MEKERIVVISTGSNQNCLTSLIQTVNVKALKLVMKNDVACCSFYDCDPLWYILVRVNLYSAVEKSK